VPSILLANTDGCGDSGCSPLGGAPVERETLLNDVVHSSTALLKRGLVVRAMTEDNVNIVELQTFKRVLESFDNVFAAHHCVVETSGAGFIDLGGDNDALTSHVEVFKSLAHLDLGLTHAVDFCGVEEVDAEAKTLFDR